MPKCSFYRLCRLNKFLKINGSPNFKHLLNELSVVSFLRIDLSEQANTKLNVYIKNTKYGGILSIIQKYFFLISE